MRGRSPRDSDSQTVVLYENNPPARLGTPHHELVDEAVATAQITKLRSLKLKR